MTSELEQQFFDTFGIEPSCPQGCAQIGLSQNCDECAFYDCPPITDKILLEMICIYNSTYTNGYTNYSLLNERNVEKLKEQILKNCLIVRDDIKHQIQRLFKEEE